MQTGAPAIDLVSCSRRAVEPVIRNMDLPSEHDLVHGRAQELLQSSRTLPLDT